MTKWGLITLSLLKSNLIKQQQQQQQQQQQDLQILICQIKLKGITIHLLIRKTLCQRFLYLQLNWLEIISNKLAGKCSPHTQPNYYKAQ